MEPRWGITRLEEFKRSGIAMVAEQSYDDALKAVTRERNAARSISDSWENLSAQTQRSYAEAVKQRDDTLEAFKAIKRELIDLKTRVTDVADSLLGLQEVAPSIELLDRIERHCADSKFESDLQLAAVIAERNEAWACFDRLDASGGNDPVDPDVDQEKRSPVRCESRTPYQESRAAFDIYCAMDAPRLPDDEHAALQVMLHRWEVRVFGGSVEESTMGVGEEVGELAEAAIMLLGASSAAGRMARCITKRKHGQRGMEDMEAYRAAMADAIADLAIYAIGASTKLRLDFWTIVAATAAEVMYRNRPGDPDGYP